MMLRHFLRFLLAPALGAAFCLGLPPALAADTAPAPAKPSTATPKTAPKPAPKAREASFGKGTGSVMTRDQLRQCMTDQDRMKKEAADILQTQLGLDRDRAEIDRTGAELEAGKASLDRTSQAAIDAYNERALARAKLIGDYKAAASPFNERVDKLTDDRQAYAKDCQDRRYLEEDYDAIKAGK